MKSKIIYIALFVCMFYVAAGAPTKSLQDFKIRGVHLDLRIQVMKMPALKQFALRLSKEGINTIIMEWEGTYPFKEDPLIANRYAYTREEVKGFVDYCKSLNIDVIPLQQSFGHVEYILRHPKYAALREDAKDLSQVCPSEVNLNKVLFTRLFKDMAAMHPSPYFHIGGDETHLLGHCEKCKKKAAEVGISRVYFDHIKMLCDIVTSLGKRPVLWADIALKYPQYIHLLPKETVFVDWNYGWEPSHFGQHEALLNSGYEIWGAPAIRSSPDNYYLTRWQYHFNNLKDFIPFCRKNKYSGIIMTSWSTSGEYSPVYESEDALVELTALRHVYPITGFDILISAYLKAIHLEGSLNISEFITNYCHEKFGFDKTQAKQFQVALFTAPYTIKEGVLQSHSSISIKEVLDSSVMASNIFKELKPEKNQQYYKQIQLMADIRVFYLRYILIEKEINADVDLKNKIPYYIGELELLRRMEQPLNERFITLNKDVLYPTALEEENNLRNQKINNLYNKLSSIK